VGFFLTASLYNVTSTSFEAPDEMQHFYYIVHLLENRTLPTMPPQGELPHYRQEGSQAPLYYLSAALWVRLLSTPLHLSLDDAHTPFYHNPHSTCGDSFGQRYNVTYLGHDAHKERFPFGGRSRVLHVVRGWSTVLATATIAGIFFTARLIFPRQPTAAWVAAGITACTPEFLFTAGAVNNDNMVIMISTWTLYGTLRILNEGERILWWQPPLFGALAGLATLGKLGGLMLLPLTGWALLLKAYQRNPVQRGEKERPHDTVQMLRRLYRAGIDIIPQLLLLLGVYLAFVGWWFIRNWRLYQDITGTQAHLALMPTHETGSLGYILRQSPTLFRSWWASLGCTRPPRALYGFYLLLSGLGLLGFLRQPLTPQQRRALSLLGIWLGLMLVGYVRWNLEVHAPLGRLLYPAVVTVATVLGRGWANWLRQVKRPAVSLLAPLAGIALALPLTVMAPPTTPPPLYENPQAVEPQHRIDGRFGEHIVLLGYDLNSTSFEPGENLALTLYWYALDIPDQHYTLAIQLVSAIPEANDMLVNFNTWTGGGTYPTGLWHPGDVIEDQYVLSLPRDVAAAQLWNLQLILFDTSHNQRLTFHPSDHPQAPTLGAQLERIRVGAAAPPEIPPQVSLDKPYHFGKGIQLVALGRLKETETFVFWWRSEADVQKAYKVFVHLYDTEGELLTTGDTLPYRGGFPTSRWEVGDYVTTHATLSTPLPDDEYYLGIGWYDPESGARLQASEADGTPLPNQMLTLPLTAIPQVQDPAE
jgi:hypothetical protein